MYILQAYAFSSLEILNKKKINKYINPLQKKSIGQPIGNNMEHLEL
jgi:hypothetical protein